MRRTFRAHATEYFKRYVLRQPAPAFVYLIQGRHEGIKNWAFLKQTGRTFYYLYYNSEGQTAEQTGENIIPYPNSTWAEGRNHLLEILKAREVGWEYAVFLDEDVQISGEALTAFETLLQTHKPDIGLPLCDIIERTGRADLSQEIQRPVGLDQLMQAFSRRAIEEGIVVPYDTTFDDISWWYACEINEQLILRLYGDRTLQFNTVSVTNGFHGYNAQDDSYALPESLYRGGMDAAGKQQVIEYVTSAYQARMPRQD